ncbi:MAG: nitrate reductase cytochrome c-type subunit [Steroidobacteraceae bacterium]
MNRITMAAIAAVLAGGMGLAACTSAPTASAAPAGPVASLRGSDAATTDQAPVVHTQLGKKPGLQQKIVRTFDGQPPLIPHATDNFDEVTVDANQCLDCHGADVFQKKNAPKIPVTHFVGRDGQTLAGTDERRHSCTLCHVPQFDAPPLVGNSFVGAPPKKQPAASN